MCEVHKPEKWPEWMKNIEVILSNGKKGSVADLQLGDIICITAGISEIEDQRPVKIISIPFFVGGDAEVLNFDGNHADCDFTLVSKIRILTASEVFCNFQDKFKKIREAVSQIMAYND